MLIHGTCIELFGLGVLLRGPSGSGKSDLALRLIDSGARLVADDQVALTVEAGQVRATGPSRIAGRMEVRGLGIVEVATIEAAPVALVVDLVAPEDVPRLPEPSACELAGIAVRSIALAPFEASTVAKVRLAVLAESRNSGADRAAGSILTSE
jgi:serine kinase of HPr protein (carbohydrate metabolism regulator)